jgi:hypothetical protein
MIVQLVWPDCNYLHGTWTYGEKEDGFWVECSPVEGKLIEECHVLPKRIKPVHPSVYLHRNDRKLWQYFLVSRSLSSVWPPPRITPFSGHWNGYCPFRKLRKPIEINCLEELQHVVIPDTFRWN